jgi:predicted RNase H-like HicB family nuclease
LREKTAATFPPARGGPSDAKPDGTSRANMTYKFAVIFEASATGYGAYVPELPGCVAVGSTLEETERLVVEAIELHIDAMTEDGEELPSSEPFATKIVELKVPATT